MKTRGFSALCSVCAVLVLVALALGSAYAGATRNVILMIGDGMGFQHVNAASYYLYGASGGLCFEPYYKGGVNTSLLNSGTYPFTDSAAAASALATGHKVNWTSVSQLSPTSTDTSPTAPPTTATPVLYTTILEHAKAMGKRTGFVGNDPISRATPAAFGCHDHSRYRYQLLTDDLLNSSQPDVMMGGGATPAGGGAYVSTAQVATAVSLGYQVAYTKAQMDAISDSASRVLGLFKMEDLTYEYDRRNDPGTTEPHIREQTAKALALLNTDPDGFFLMVEGAKIDYAAHANDIIRTTWETVEFNKSVQVVLDWMEARENTLGYQDTLLIVAGDHETGGLTATNNGQGNYAGATWTSTDHTAANVPLYAVGSNADLVNDYISGGVMDNTNVFTAMYRAFTTAPYAAAPYKIYDQSGFLTTGSGNEYYAGGVFDGTFYTGQITSSAQQWDDHQTSGNAMMNYTPEHVPSNAVAKCSIPMNGFPAAGGWLYIGGSTGGMYRTSSWASTTISQLSVPSSYLTESMCTDGTYIYMSSGTSAQYHKIFKYSVNHTTGALTSVTSWPVAIGTATTVRFRGISYYNGKIYAVNHKGTGNQIYEIDTTTRTVTTLATVPLFGASSDNAYQCVRYGNQIFVVGLDDTLHTYDLSGTTWTLSSSVDLGLTDLYGIGVKGDGTKAQYAWVTHLPSKVAFCALTPWTAPPTDLDDPGNWTNNNGYPVYMSNAVVTAVNPTTAPKGLWIENQERMTGAYVFWNGTMPAVNHLVSVISGSVTSSGEKTLTASSVTANEDYTAKPLFITNKSMGLATDGLVPPTLNGGLANGGLLVTVSGRVTGYNAGTGAFYIDDGSGVPSDASPTLGVKVWKVDGTGMTLVPNYLTRVVGALPSYAVVTGVVRLDLAGGNITRRIDARSDADIVITAL